MTTREKLNLTIESNKIALGKIKKMSVNCTIAAIAALIILWTLDIFGGNSTFISLIKLLPLLIVLVPVIIIFRIKKSMNKLLCPKCKNDLDYLFISKDYNPKCDYTAFPPDINKCPFCKINLDDNID